jgi:hypothetical protein
MSTLHNDADSDVKPNMKVVEFVRMGTLGPLGGYNSRCLEYQKAYQAQQLEGKVAVCQQRIDMLTQELLCHKKALQEHRQDPSATFGKVKRNPGATETIGERKPDVGEGMKAHANGEERKPDVVAAAVEYEVDGEKLELDEGEKGSDSDFTDIDIDSNSAVGVYTPDDSE